MKLPRPVRHSKLADQRAVSTTDIPTCPLCGCESFQVFSQGFDYEMVTCRNQWTFVECSKCTHVWLNPRPDISELPLIYPSNYYSYDYAKKINSIAVWAKKQLDKRKVHRILVKLQNRPNRFLDVGCGDGRFLRAMAALGLSHEDIFGVEIDQHSIEELQKEGFSVVAGRIEDCDHLPPGEFDLITCFHVIEHVAEPDVLLGKLSGLLRVNGVLAIETPNIDSVDARIFKESYWGGYHFPRHWHLFRESTLRRIFDVNNFEILDFKYQTGHSFWLYSFHHMLLYHFGWSRFARVFDPLRSLPPLMLVTAWDMVRATLGFRTSAVLVIARKK